MKVFQQNFNIKTVDASRVHEVDMDNIPFGRIFSDHMLVAKYENGAWQTPEIRPYGSLNFTPSISALNYGQSVFEGMKAIKGPTGDVLLFRRVRSRRISSASPSDLDSRGTKNHRPRYCGSLALDDGLAGLA